MAKTHNLAALDIGTSSIKLLLVQKEADRPDFEVITQLREPTLGVRKGVVVNVDEVSRAIRAVLNKAKEETDQKINAVYVNIGGSHIFSTSSRGTVAVSRADQKISEEDVERILQAARTFSLPSNKEILDSFPKEFIIDGEGGIKEPIGMQGVRLEAEVLILGCFSPYLNNLTQCVLDSDLQILDVVPSPLASAAAVLNQKQKELGVALLEIGAGTSGLAVFEEGDLIHLAIFPIGSANITNDIAIGLKTDVDVAERIKTEFGTCLLKNDGKKTHFRTKEKIIVEEEPLVFSQKQLTGIIEARVSEIFNQCQKELKNISKQGLLPAGLVVTGGGAKIPKILEVAKKEIKLHCRIGKPAGFTGLEDELSFATACGLISGAVDVNEKSGWEKGGSFLGEGKIGKKIKKFLKIFVP